jgi:hypothetical protein
VEVLAIVGTSSITMISATTPSTTDRPTFVLEFRPEPECADAIRALKALLKVAKRQLKLQCVSAHESADTKP